MFLTEIFDRSYQGRTNVCAFAIMLEESESTITREGSDQLVNAKLKKHESLVTVSYRQLPLVRISFKNYPVRLAFVQRSFAVRQPFVYRSFGVLKRIQGCSHVLTCLYNITKLTEAIECFHQNKYDLVGIIPNHLNASLDSMFSSHKYVTTAIYQSWR